MRSFKQFLRPTHEARQRFDLAGRLAWHAQSCSPVRRTFVVGTEVSSSQRLIGSPPTRETGLSLDGGSVTATPACGPLASHALSCLPAQYAFVVETQRTSEHISQRARPNCVTVLSRGAQRGSVSRLRGVLRDMCRAVYIFGVSSCLEVKESPRTSDSAPLRNA